MKKTIGLLAHVDAGKTTVSEQILMMTHAVRKAGRVDHGDTFLDSHPIERQRGITVFSGQACISVGEDTVYWLDTPGHTDFSTQMERSLSVLDFAVLILSSVEGIQSHTLTLWRLLDKYHVPVFLFMNKTDRQGADPDGLLKRIRKRLSAECIDLRSWQADTRSGLPVDLREEIASRDEELLERFLMDNYEEDVWIAALRKQIRTRQCFPVLAGSALRGEGMEGFLNLLFRLTETEWAQKKSAPFQARVYRVRHDENGGRLCFMKVQSGEIRVRDDLPLPSGNARITELRIYHGEKYRTVDKAEAGDLIAIPGMTGLKPGDELSCTGVQGNAFDLEPMMASDLIWDDKVLPAFKMMECLQSLSEEEPSLHFEEYQGRISCRVMGKVQLQVLETLIEEKCGQKVGFGPCRVIYRETIRKPVIGWGHYEPLRHYAQVVFRLKPGKPGSGITFRSCCKVDTLAVNWQRLIETHVFERTHHGVLTGADLTDLEIELLCGRSHIKHTEGGDFREAVSRAIRNGLMRAENVLLEPICAFSLSVPLTSFGNVSAALNRIQAETDIEQDEDQMLIQGHALWSRFMTFQEDFQAMTHGHGSLRLWPDGYAPCPEQDAVVAASGYEPLAQETADSVFCSHGAGMGVAWYMVPEWVHCGNEWDPEGE